jgi:hypothetical protein
MPSDILGPDGKILAFVPAEDDPKQTYEQPTPVEPTIAKKSADEVPKTTRTKRTSADKPRTTPMPAATPTPPSPELDAARTDGIKGLVQIGAVLALALDSRTPESNVAFRADAVTLAGSADAIAEAVTETARHNASFAAAVDKVTAAGPYAALVTVTFGVGMQLARNHGVNAAEMFGAKDPHVILQEVGTSNDNQAA